MRKLLTIAVLALTQSGDTMLSVALVWTALRESSSATTLSIVLTVMTIAPFLVQRLLPWTKQWIARVPASAFRVARLSGIVIGIAGIVLPYPLAMVTLYALAGLFAAVAFLAQQSLETMMSEFVIAGAIESREASRMLQTGTQLGAFVGGAFGGLLFERAGIRTIFVVLCATVLVGALVPMLLSGAAAAAVRKREAAAGGAAAATPFAGTRAQRQALLWMALIAIGVLTVQVGAFNLFVPILCEKVKHWQAADYGVVTACAGLGALIATVKLVPDRYHHLLSAAAAVGIFAVDLGFWLTDRVAVAALLAALGGFSVNTLRIAARASIYETVASAEEGAEWSGRTTVMFQATKATVPLALAGVLAWYGLSAAGAAFAATGAVLAALLVTYLVQQGRLRALLTHAAGAATIMPPPARDISAAGTR